VRERTIRVGGADVRLVEAGEGPLVMLIHGWGGSPRFWERVHEPLASRGRCVAPDLAGFHASGRVTIPALADGLVELAAALDPAPARWVGHSMGGMISASVAASRPEAVARLVLVNAPIRGARALFGRTRLMLAWPLRRLCWAMLRFGPTRGLITRDFSWACAFPEALGRELARGPYEALVQSARALCETDLTPVLGRIAAPTLVIGSDHDRLVRADQFEAACAGIGGARREIFAETGHCPMIERPDAFVRAVEGFLF
jgi:pimeloyl-ACP methyl ester carboxylesterase